jgi:hypothetical protein
MSDFKFQLNFPYDAAELEVSRHRTGGVWLTLGDRWANHNLVEMTPAQANSLAAALQQDALWSSNPDEAQGG